tara:strand:+ start:537 stop:950 length:414 start_codon:yes stop_codon:yes gene_type:complete
VVDGRAIGMIGAQDESEIKKVVVEKRGGASGEGGNETKKGAKDVNVKIESKDRDGMKNIPRSAALSQLPLVDGEESGEKVDFAQDGESKSAFPLRVFDPLNDNTQVDLRKENSWTARLHQVSKKNSLFVVKESLRIY